MNDQPIKAQVLLFSLDCHPPLIMDTMDDSLTSGELISPSDPSLFDTQKLSRTSWTAFIVVTLALYVGWYYSSLHKSGVKVPGPRGIPIFGSILKLRNGQANVFAAWNNKYKDMFRVILGSKDVVSRGWTCTRHPSVLC